MSLQSLVAFVREKSPFYRELYKQLPGKLPMSDTELLALLPVIDSAEFWKANSLHDNTLLTGPMNDGIVFKSGGTTGAPKFSVFSRTEWTHFCRTFGRGLTAGGLQEGERVANLFYAGELYASFIFIMKSFEEATKGSLHLPLGGATSPESVLKTIRDLSATTVAGTPTLLVQLAETLAREGGKASSLKRLLFGGESLYEDQRERLLEVFPGVTIQSIGYASVDAGLLGYADPSCAPEEHRTFGAETIFEIIDEATGRAVDALGVEGKAFVTYLDRTLMPIIRYPVGDRAVWVEEKGAHADRRFKLLGRSEEAARVGPVSIFYDDVREIFHSAGFSLTGFQLFTKHYDRKDQLVIRLSVSHETSTLQLVTALLKARPMLKEEAERGNIHLPAVEIVSHSELEKNPRTGKMKRVIDLRQK
jgi:phenylacetate-CoA ligase